MRVLVLWGPQTLGLSVFLLTGTTLGEAWYPLQKILSFTWTSQRHVYTQQREIPSRMFMAVAFAMTVAPDWK